MTSLELAVHLAPLFRPLGLQPPSTRDPAGIMLCDSVRAFGLSVLRLVGERRVAHRLHCGGLGLGLGLGRGILCAGQAAGERPGSPLHAVLTTRLNDPCKAFARRRRGEQPREAVHDRHRIRARAERRVAAAGLDAGPAQLERGLEVHRQRRRAAVQPLSSEL